MNLSYDPVVERIGWMLLHSVWLLLAPAALLSFFLVFAPQSSSRLRHALALGTLTIMAILPVASVPFISVPANSNAQTEPAVRPRSAAWIDRDSLDAVPRSERQRPTERPSLDEFKDEDHMVEPAAGRGLGRAVVVRPDRASTKQSKTALPEVADDSSARRKDTTSSKNAEESRLQPLLSWAVAAWLAGVLVMSFRLLAGWRSTRRLRRQGTRVVPQRVELLFMELQARIGSCQAARLVQSTLVSVPSVVGHLRPVVLLPVSAVTGLSEEQLRAILAHELAHVKRRDFLVNIYQSVIEALLFYHPAVWWVSHCVRIEREHCCDDIALQHGCRASELAQALVTVDAIRPASAMDLTDSALITAADGGNLLRRVRRLAGRTADQHVVRRSWIAGGVALGLLVAAMIAGVASLEGVAEESGFPGLEGDTRNGAEQAASAADEEQERHAKEPDTPQSHPESLSNAPIANRAPHDVPWPDKTWTKSLPPSGNGIRVELGDRRWVEFNSVYARRAVGDEQSQVHWTADGELIDPPADFDPKSLVPEEDKDRMPAATRGFLMQVVGPESMRVALNTSGFGGYGSNSYPVGGSFVQIPLKTIARGINDNFAYVEVKVSREAKELISLKDARFQVLSDPKSHRVYVATENARGFAWRLMIDRDGEASGVEPYLVGGRAKTSVPDGLKARLKDEFQDAQLLGFGFDDDQPMPTLLSLERSPYDTVRFDNLSVYPGPRTAVVTSVNGVPIDEANHPDITPRDEAEGAASSVTRSAADDQVLETVALSGQVVDDHGFGVADCWVGLFIESQEHLGQSNRAPPWAKEPLAPFSDGPPLAAATRTLSDGTFTILAPKTHFVFEGSFWAVDNTRRVTSKTLNAVWSYVQKPGNLKLTLREAHGSVRFVDSNENPVPRANVSLEAVRVPRGVTHRVPEAVQAKLVTSTDDSGEVDFPGVETAGIRGVAVTADGFGTQFLSDRLASSWIRDGEPLTLKLRSTASLSGRVVNYDPKRDFGLELLVRTEQHDDRPPLYGRGVAEVNPDGTFRIDQIAAGRVSIESSLSPDSDRKMRLSEIPSLNEGEHRQIEAEHCPRMEPAVTVRQQLVKSDTGEGIAGSRLRVLWGDGVDGGSWSQSKALTTDESGWWSAKVLAGKINIRLGTLPDGYRSTAWFDGRHGRLGVEAMVPATDKLVTLPPERYVPAVELTGRLEYDDGSPAAEWSVYGHPISWDDVGVGGVQTYRDGSFTLTYPVGYPPRFFQARNRQWMTEHDFTDRYVVPQVTSSDPLVLQVSETQTQDGNRIDADGTEDR